jgi:hypothetical protein
MLLGARRLIGLAALGMVVSCGQPSVTVPGVMVTPALLPNSVASPAATVVTRPIPFTVPGVAACRPSDLRVSLQAANPSYVGAGSPNTMWWQIDVRDAGFKPCFVGPTPDVSFYTSSGRMQIPKSENWPGNIVYLAPAVDPAPPFFSSATGSVGIEGCYIHSLERVTIDLGPALGTVVTTPGPAGGYGVACPAAGDSYFTELYGGGTNEVTGGWAPLTQTSIRAPSSAHPGERLEFQITLENSPAPRLGNDGPKSSTWTFIPCPMFYDEIEGVVGTFQISHLDCGHVKPIAAGNSETLDMHIDIPLVARLGPATLIWSIVGSPELYQEGTSYLPIT